MASTTTQSDSGFAAPSWLAPEMDAVVHELTGYERSSASEGEGRAAEWLAAHLRRLGHPARVEGERAHGGYWWPLGLLNGGAAVAGLAAQRSRSRWMRLLAAGLGTGIAAAIWDEVG